MSSHAYTEDQLAEQHFIDAAALSTCGWQLFALPILSETALAKALLSLASRLGEPTPTRTRGGLIDSLSPIKADMANPRSLSMMREEGEFPLHIDTAHWLTPCRYVLIACVSPGDGNRPTFLLDTRRLPLSDDQISLLHCTPLRVTNGRDSFFSSILSRSRTFVRVDPGCMLPTSAAGADALSIFDRERWPNHVETVQWKAGMVLLLDNWRTLHGRGRATAADTDRKLLRVSIR